MWVAIVQIVVRMIHKQAGTHTHKNTVAATKGIPRNATAVAPWLPRGTELGGRGDTCTAADRSKNKEAELGPHFAFLVRMP